MAAVLYSIENDDVSMSESERQRSKSCECELLGADLAATAPQLACLTAPPSPVWSTNTALCVFGKRGPKMFNIFWTRSDTRKEY